MTNRNYKSYLVLGNEKGEEKKYNYKFLEKSETKILMMYVAIANLTEQEEHEILDHFSHHKSMEFIEEMEVLLNAIQK